MERRLGGVLTTCARRRTTDGSMSFGGSFSIDGRDIDTEFVFDEISREKRSRIVVF
jgi:hypothetical protein